MQAADEILGGRFRDQFVVDVYQAGAGTSPNMNANEVIATVRRTARGARGEYRDVHPTITSTWDSRRTMCFHATRLALLLVIATCRAARRWQRRFAIKPKSSTTS